MPSPPPDASDGTVAPLGHEQEAPPGHSGGASPSPGYRTTAIDIPIHRFRVLFSDGEVEDFLANRDDSVLREHMLKTHWGARGKPEHGDRKDQRGIVGVTDLGLVYTHTPVDGSVGNGSAIATDATATDTPVPKKRTLQRQKPPP